MTQLCTRQLGEAIEPSSLAAVKSFAMERDLAALISCCRFMESLADSDRGQDLQEPMNFPLSLVYSLLK